MNPYGKLFIGGCARSGTTWVRTIFYGHPDVVPAGKSEPAVYRVLLNPVLTGMRGDEAWNKVMAGYDDYVRRRKNPGLFGERAELQGLIGQARSQPGTELEQGLWLIRQVYDRHFASVGGQPHQTLVEKTPANILYASLILRQFPEARFVEVVRDGRDVCASDRRRFNRNSVEEIIERWIRFIEAGEAVEKDPVCHGRHLRVHYEDLKEDLRGNVVKLLDFAGLPVRPELVDQITKASSLGEMKTTHKWHVWKGEVGTWRDELSAPDQALIRTVAGDVLEARGYAHW